MKKLCFVATIPAIVDSFLRSHIEAIALQFDVTVVCNETDAHLIAGLPARIIWLPIERNPAPWRDLAVLIQMVKLFRREQFDIVHSHFPKSGLLGMLAAWIARVPVRVHTFHGEVWATRKGLRRFVLKSMDYLVARLATDILSVSASLQQHLVNEGVLRQGQSRVIGAGSICGVDPDRFHPDTQARTRIRNTLGMAPFAKLLLYVGRLNRDKGLLDLAAAFVKLSETKTETHLDIHLLLVGTEEDIAFSQIQQLCRNCLDRLHYVSYSTTPEHYMAAADIFCLPSYREGFGLTIIEAAACGVPAVATRITGVIDAVSEGSTGLLYEPGQLVGLTDALLTLLINEPLRQSMGMAALSRAVTLFSSKMMASDIRHFYETLTLR